MRARLSPPVVIAILALVAAVAGTAVAGPGATSSGLTKKKVRSIADKEIGKLAPGLSVASAANAANAANAETLDNLDSTQLTPAAGDGRTADLTLTAADQTVLSANITTAASGTLVASAALQVQGGTRAECTLRFDGTSSSAFFATSTTTEESLAAVWAQGVGPGAHTVELRCNSPSGAVVDEGGLAVTAHL